MNIRFLTVILLMMMGTFATKAQDLLNERIRKVNSRKQSIYLESGIFHNGGKKLNSTLKAVRHAYSKQKGYERLVFDFKTSDVPRIYGHIASDQRKLYIDLFDTTLSTALGSFGNSKYIKGINFFPMDENSLSVEVEFKEKVTVEVFDQSSPGRLVVDIKG